MTVLVPLHLDYKPYTDVGSLSLVKLRLWKTEKKYITDIAKGEVEKRDTIKVKIEEKRDTIPNNWS